MGVCVWVARHEICQQTLKLMEKENINPLKGFMFTRAILCHVGGCKGVIFLLVSMILVCAWAWWDCAVRLSHIPMERNVTTRNNEC